MTDPAALLQDARDLRAALKELMAAMAEPEARMDVKRAAVVRARAMVILTDYLDKE